MTPEAQRMYDEMVELQEKLALGVATAAPIVASVDSKLKNVETTLRELIICDEKLFDKIFSASFADEHKYEVICTHLGITKQQIDLSRDPNETVSFAQYTMLHEALAELYNIARYACDISRRDFCVAWILLNEDGSLGQILMDAEKMYHKLAPGLADRFQKKKDTSPGTFFDVMMKLGNPSGLVEEDNEEYEH